MRSLRHKLGYRRGDPDRHSFAFFVIGTLVVIAVAFFLGFQLGRYVEKTAVKEAAGKIVSPGPAAENAARIDTSAEIRKDMSAFSEEASKIPGVAPPAAMLPTAGDDLRKTESEATFPESLSRKDPSPEPMARTKEKAKAPAPSVEGKYHAAGGGDEIPRIRRRLAEATRSGRIQGEGDSRDDPDRSGRCTAFAWGRSDPATRP